MADPVVPGTSQAQNSYESQLLRNQFGTNGQLGLPTSGSGTIYLGPDYDETNGIPLYLQKPGLANGIVTTDQAKNLVWQFDDEQRKEFDDLIEQGGQKRPDSMESRLYWWNKMVDYAGTYSSNIGKNVSPFDMAKMWASNAKPYSSGGAGGGPSTTVYKDEQVNLTNPSTARSVLDGALGRYLGRMPSQKEYKAFLGALTMAEEAAPTISQRVTRNSGGQNQTVTSKGKSQGGLNAAQFATEYAKGEESYAETQLSTTGLQAFLGMLK